MENAINQKSSKFHKEIAQPSLKSLIERIQELFERKFPGCWHVHPNILTWFDHQEAESEQRIDFAPSLETLEVWASEGTMLFHKRAIKLPLIQGLELVIDLVKDDKIPIGHPIIIFLETRKKNGIPCKLLLWRRTVGVLELNVFGVTSINPLWINRTRVVRKKETNL